MPEMADGRRSCGFTAAEGVDETINDHLLGVFAPGLKHEKVL
jgi:hypothetical protein